MFFPAINLHLHGIFHCHVWLPEGMLTSTVELEGWQGMCFFFDQRVSILIWNSKEASWAGWMTVHVVNGCDAEGMTMPEESSFGDMGCPRSSTMFGRFWLPVRRRPQNWHQYDMTSSFISKSTSRFAKSFYSPNLSAIFRLGVTSSLHKRNWHRTAWAEGTKGSLGARVMRVAWCCCTTTRASFGCWWSGVGAFSTDPWREDAGRARTAGRTLNFSSVSLLATVINCCLWPWWSSLDMGNHKKS